MRARLCSAVMEYPYNGAFYTGTFTPLPELTRTDGDLSIIFLNNNGIPVAGTNGPCEDPFFSATGKQLDSFPDYYMADSPVTAIGCLDQYQLRNTVTGELTDYSGMLDLGQGVENWAGSLSHSQFAAMAQLQWSIGQIGGIGSTVEAIGADALRAKKYPGVFDNFQNPLPNDQWKNEVGYWFDIGLAKLQLLFVNIATGPQEVGTPGLTNVLPVMASGAKSGTDYVDLICHSQKIHDGDFKNFHRAGFIVLAVLGILLLVFPSLFTKFIIWRFRNRADVLAWTTYGNLQLLRLASEAGGVRDWVGCDEETPFLEPDRCIGSVDTTATDGKGRPHPVLLPPRKPESPTHGSLATSTNGNPASPTNVIPASPTSVNQTSSTNGTVRSS